MVDFSDPFPRLRQRLHQAEEDRVGGRPLEAESLPHAHVRHDGELLRPPRAAHDHRRQGHGCKYNSGQTLHRRHGVDGQQAGEFVKLENQNEGSRLLLGTN